MSDVVTSQPPPATDGGTPWGSFYTASSTGAAPALPKVAEKVKVKGRAKRKRSAEPKPEGRKSRRRVRGEASEAGEGARPDKRRSFSLRRGSDSKPDAPASAPAVAPHEVSNPGLPSVAAPAHSRRYAEPHVLVGVVGGTLIALYSLVIALLYMIGNAA